MFPRNCIAYVADKLVSEGGCAVIRKTNRPNWHYQHVMHLSSDGVITQYSPPGDLEKPIQALFGFDGDVVHGDHADWGPVPARSIVLGSYVLSITLTVWVVASWVKRMWKW